MRKPVLFILLLISSLMSFASVDDSASYLRFALVSGEAHPHTKAAQYMAKIIERESKGKLNVNLYANSELGNERKIVEQLRFGGISLAILDLQDIIDYIPQFEETLLNSTDINREEIIEYFYDHYQELISLLMESGLFPLSMLYPKLRCIYSIDKMFKNEADLAGTTIGTKDGRYYKKMIERMKAKNLVIEQGDIFSTLSNNIINGAEDSLIDFCISANYPFIKNVSITEHTSLPSFILISLPIYQSLEDDEKDILKTAAIRATYYANSLLKRQEDSYINRMNSEKNVIIWR